MGRTRAHIVVSGLVQGVFFRSNTRDEAKRLGLTGWAKNRWDGTVEAVVEGDEDKVKRLITWCRHGPPSAVVEDVKVDWEDYRGEFESFSITW